MAAPRSLTTAAAAAAAAAHLSIDKVTMHKQTWQECRHYWTTTVAGAAASRALPG